MLVSKKYDSVGLAFKKSSSLCPSSSPTLFLTSFPFFTTSIALCISFDLLIKAKLPFPLTMAPTKPPCFSTSAASVWFQLSSKLTRRQNTGEVNHFADGSPYLNDYGNSHSFPTAGYFAIAIGIIIVLMIIFISIRQTGRSQAASKQAPASPRTWRSDMDSLGPPPAYRAEANTPLRVLEPAHISADAEEGVVRREKE